MQKTSVILVALASLLASAPVFAQSVFINEIHYDNSSNDLNEGVEIAGPAGTDLTAFKLVFYNGANGNSYQELPLGGTIPAQGGTAFGTKFFPQSAIQNGGPDGIALIDTVANSTVQFLSYEGSFTANNGDAAGETSDDIGVDETSSTSPNESLQLIGSGSVYSDFTWRPPAAASPDNINSGQTFIGAGNPSITLTLMPDTISEGESGTATIALFPPPAAPVVITIVNSDLTELSTQAQVTVPISGNATFAFSAIEDGENDGTRSAEIRAIDGSGFYDPGSATALVQDAQRPTRGTAIRLATVNVKNGVGGRGSAEYAAVLALIERLEPDIVAFQEVSSSGDFFDLRELMDDLGFPHLATTDDAFTGQTYSGGHFNSDQNIAIASLYPIVSTKQIERGEAGRREVTRFPLMVEIDVPGTANDPTVVAVHYKASSDTASRYRKAVEAYRTLEAIAAAGVDGTQDNIFVLGDVNEDHDRFMPNSFNTANTIFGDGSNLPGSYQLGADISGANSITIPYAQFPDQIFANANLITPVHFQQDGSAKRTFITLGDAALDYIIHSQQVADNGNTSSEIYNSSLDRSFDGKIKQGLPAPPATSFDASDHFAVFGDYELDPKSRITLSLSPTSIAEDAGTAAVTGTLTLTPAPTTAVTVELLIHSTHAPLRLPFETIDFSAGESQKTFPVDVIDRSSADPDRTITITASAPGYSPAGDSVRVLNLEPGGQILISQYTETPSGSAPRGIELFNCSGRDIDLRAEPIHIIQYTNGSTNGILQGIANEGTFPAGAVVVLGDANIGEYLVAEGLLNSPDPPLNIAENATHYVNGSGDLIYVKEFFPYNGDDALEAQFAYELSDVFGNIGQDPGSAWQSGGVSTSGQNLSLLADVGIASAGFTQPDRRFTTTAPGNQLDGFGIAPAANDPIKIWLHSFGLTDLNADSDCDGLNNLLEFATGSDPTDPGSGFPPTLEDGSYSFRQLSSPGRIVYEIESSTDLETWEPANLTQTGNSPNGDGTSTATFSFPKSGLRAFLRLRVSVE